MEWSGWSFFFFFFCRGGSVKCLQFFEAFFFFFRFLLVVSSHFGLENGKRTHLEQKLAIGCHTIMLHVSRLLQKPVGMFFGCYCVLLKTQIAMAQKENP